MSELTLEFGSRSGSWLTLALFGCAFGLVGLLAGRAIRRSSPEGSGLLARLVGLALFLGPLVLLWLSTVNGFYTAEVVGGQLHLRPLAGPSHRVAVVDVARTTAAPWYRGRWRLRIVDSAGRRFESATSSRDHIEKAVAQLSAVLRR